MKKLLLTFAVLFTMVSSLHAVTIAWTVNNPNPGTDGGWGMSESETLYCYFVYSATNLADEANDPTYSGVRDAALKSTAVGKSTVDPMNSQYNTYALDVKLSKEDWDAAGYYYLVVFKAASNTVDALTSAEYLVAGTETKWEGSTNENGIYADATQGSENTDNLRVDFIVMDPLYSGINAPEPTALALLALGVAGVALRRKMK